MSSFNKVILMGNITRDIEVRYTTSGTAVSTIGMAINRKWFDKNTNQQKESTTFVDVDVWGKSAENMAERLGKGSLIHVEGRLQLDQWEDQQSGQNRSKLKVVCENCTWLPKGTGGGSPPDRSQQRERSQSQNPHYEPFPEESPDDETAF